MHRVLGYAKAVVEAGIGLLLLNKDALEKVSGWGPGPLSVRSIVGGMYVLGAIVNLGNKAFGDRAIIVDLRKRQVTRNLKTMLSYLDNELNEESRGKIRANVFQYSKGQLRMIAHHGDYSVAELRTRWAIGQGACGICFDLKKSVFCGLEVVNDADASTDIPSGSRQISIEMTRDSYGKTRDVQWVFASILKDYDGQGWGVLCVDSTSMAVSEETRDTVRRVVDAYREAIRSCCCIR